MRLTVLVLSLSLTLCACGKKGPLVYPEMLVPAAPSGLEVHQAGAALKVTFLLPSKDLAGRPVSKLSAVKVLKRDEPGDQAPGCKACVSDYSLFRTINLDMLQSDTQRYGNQLVLLDEDVAVGRAYTFRASAVTAANQEGALSTPVVVRMATIPAAPVIRIVTHPTELHIEFAQQSPQTASVTGYTVYRSLKGQPYPFVPLATVPVAGDRFVDTGLERGTIYVYRVRSVMQGSGVGSVESATSNEVEGMLKDDE